MAGGVPLSEWSGSGATRELHETIKAFNKEATAQASAMVCLTKWIAGLTPVMAVGLVVQIVLAWGSRQ
jgi:hypothetical protein